MNEDNEIFKEPMPTGDVVVDRLRMIIHFSRGICANSFLVVENYKDAKYLIEEEQIDAVDIHTLKNEIDLITSASNRNETILNDNIHFYLLHSLSKEYSYFKDSLTNVKTSNVYELYLTKFNDYKTVVDYVKENDVEEILSKMNEVSSNNLFDNDTLKQDSKGIYKLTVTDDDKVKKKYITNFRIVSVSRFMKITNYDEEFKNGKRKVELVSIDIVSPKGEKFNFVHELTIFNDSKSLKSALLSTELVVYAKNDEVDMLKEFLTSKMIFKAEKMVQGNTLSVKNRRQTLTTNKGTYYFKDNNIKLDKTLTALTHDDVMTDFNQELSKGELEELFKHLFNFHTFENCSVVVANCIANLTTAFIEKAKVSRHSLCMIGAKNSGKSFAMFNVIYPLLGFNVDKRIETFSMTKAVFSSESDCGNYPFLIEEYKITEGNKWVAAMVDEYLRAFFNNNAMPKKVCIDNKWITGNQIPQRQLIFNGETGIEAGSAEDRLVTLRFFVIKDNGSVQASRDYLYADANKPNSIMNKLFNKCLEYCLKLTETEYKALRKQYKQMDTQQLTGRVKDNTFVTLATGAHILSEVCKECGYSFDLDKHIDAIKNIMTDLYTSNNDLSEAEKFLMDLEDYCCDEADVETVEGTIIARATTVYHHKGSYYMLFNNLYDEYSKSILPNKLPFTKREMSSRLVSEGFFKSKETFIHKINSVKLPRAHLIDERKFSELKLENILGNVNKINTNLKVII